MADPMTIAQVVTAVVTSGTTALVIKEGWEDMMGGRAKKEAERRAAQLELEAKLKREREQQLVDTYTLRRPGKWRTVDGNGEIGYLELGTAASRQCPSKLMYHKRLGVAADVGGVLLAELAEKERKACRNGIDDEFQPRVTEMRCRNLPGGLHGASPEDAEGMKHLWYNDVRVYTQEWLRYLDHFTTHELLIGWASPGGHMALLPTIVGTYRERYPHKPIYLLTFLDSRDVTRERFPVIRSRIANLVDGMIVIDNRRDQQRNDVAAQILFPAMSAGGLIGTLPTQIGNALAQLFAKHRSVRYATLSAWAETLPVMHLEENGELDEVYYTKGNLLEEKVTRGIKQVVTNRDLQSVALDPAGLGHTRIVYVIAPINPDPDFTELAQRVDTNLAEWRKETDQNLLIHYASIEAELSPNVTEVPIVIVFLQPLATDGTELDALATETTPIEEKEDKEDKKVRRIPDPTKLIATVQDPNGITPKR